MNQPAQTEERLAASPDVLAIKVEEEMVVFHMTAGRYFGLRGAAGLIWRSIEAGTDRESAIVEEIVASHSGDADHIRADIAKTIAQMKQSGLLVAV
jgi:hypothetical protein